MEVVVGRRTDGRQADAAEWLVCDLVRQAVRVVRKVGCVAGVEANHCVESKWRVEGARRGR